MREYRNACQKSKPAPIIISKNWQVLDLSKGPVVLKKGTYAAGGYLEKRPGQYTAKQYRKLRDIHLGLDLVAPEGEVIYAPISLRFFDRAYLSGEQNYGYCLLGQAVWDGPELYLFFGHLDKNSFDRVRFDKIYEKGERVACVGGSLENGGWFPHLHFQLSFLRPQSCDIPGVCEEKDLSKYIAQCPDPSDLLGFQF